MASNTIPDAPRAPNRQLRTITVLTFIPAMALAIPAGVVSAKPLPALGLIPMAASCFLGLVVLAGKGKRFPKGPHADFIVASSLILVLILSWIHLATTHYWSSNEVMLGTYATFPMMINFCIHTYLTLLALPALFAPRSCPNCNHSLPSALPRWQRRVALPNEHIADGGPGHSRSAKEVYAPFARPYDEDHRVARESSEFQTSGFNTPRQSAETLGSERRSGEEGHEGQSLV
ncbi:hypothetical protein WHR41_03131 [Cladosporium halotolerans]|uniref:Uncharacterized protein n=1 Tax=Cladosporium halotolerans TaxID=1052096 RepID=A0AB34KV51_9PEZI